jgi:polyhydroxybutyrate depolymerase
MSHRLACELSNRIAAIADVGGVMAISLLNNTSTLHSMPVLKIHGTDDLIVPYNGQLDWSSVQQTLNHWTNFNLCNPPDTISMPNLDTLDGCTVQKIRYHFLSDSGDVIFYKVLSGGHSWPGGDTAYFTWHSLGPIGKTNIDINASELIWNFFKNYRLSEPTEVKEHIQAPSEFDLFQNYPNPFNPVTTIGYVLKDKSNAKVTLLNAIGEEVAVLVNGEQDKGFQKIDFNASTLASGVYFYRLQAGDYLQTRKMILLK